MPSICSRNWTRKQKSITSFFSASDTIRKRELPAPSVVAETSGKPKKAKRSIQPSILSFVQKKPAVTEQMVSETEDLHSRMVEESYKVVLPPTEKQQEAKKAFDRIFAPQKVPQCKHNEPCKKVKVNKAGPNKNKYFWMCDRPIGRTEGNKVGEFRCNFFKWA